MANEIGSDKEKQDKPAYDEQTLARVLEAAYVLQEHHRQRQDREARESESLAAQPPAAHDGAAAAPSREIRTRKSGGGTSKDDYTSILAQIVETQQQIQMRHLALEPALALIVERVFETTRASGAAIGILDGRMLRYRAVAGELALPVGSEVSLEKALCAASLRVGDVIRCADVNPDFLIDAAECQRRGIQSLIAVPIYQNAKIAGGLEVYYPDTHAFTEPDVHTCQLMAGLVTESLGRNEEVSWKSSLANERAVMLEALEKLQPNLAALAEPPLVKPEPPLVKEVKEAAPGVATSPLPHAHTFLCRKCGHELVGEEQFCGQCGTPRSGDYEAPTMQSKVASMLYMQEAATKKNPNGASPDSSLSSELANDSHGPHDAKDSTGDTAEDDLPELFHFPAVPLNKRTESDLGPAVSTSSSAHPGADPSPKPDLILHPHPESLEDPLLEDRLEDEEELAELRPPGELQPVALVKTAAAQSHWNSAAATRHFLEDLTKGKNTGVVSRFLAARRGYVYLVLAIILVTLVIRWDIRANHDVTVSGKPTAAAAPHRRPEADLSPFERLLVSLGLADPPDAPEYKGNPSAQVWIDLRTGLYYCPGTDLYGKTPKGKFATQRDAQFDQFEAASRKPCD